MTLPNVSRPHARLARRSLLLALSALCATRALLPSRAAEGGGPGGKPASEAPSGEPRPDILIADFEGPDYGAWKAEGEAFGPGPARGTLPNQMEVSGFVGRGLVNSFTGGDASKGSLSSPPFRIERPYLNFLIGGGGHPGTSIQLIVDGRVVRRAAGPNVVPGGSEALEPSSWDVSEFLGKEATIRIVDEETGGWGHLNVDHIVQSDRKVELATLARTFPLDAPYIHLPVKNGARKRLASLEVEGALVRQFEIELAEGTPDFWTCAHVGEFLGRSVRLSAERLPSASRALEAVRPGRGLEEFEGLYKEPLRPQFHFSPARGWTNDPNGLVFYGGEYHLFFQHNPHGVQWGNMTWGHAASEDLVHWRELPDAIHPDALGTIFSGSAVVDGKNTTGFQDGPHPPIVCIYTSAGGTNPWSRGKPFTQSIAYSLDRGRTWKKYEKNPVLAHVAGENRDPKVFWHEGSGRWVMALYLEGDRYALFGSPNLKEWSHLSDIPPFGAAECPDFFELPVEGAPGETRWVFWGANGSYLIGAFDGVAFRKEAGPFKAVWGPNDYAAQTYSDIPAADGRRIQISWMAGGRYPGMPFNQQLTVPRVLSLKKTPEGIRLAMEPVREIAKIELSLRTWPSLALEPGRRRELGGLAGDLYDIRARVDPGSASEVGLEVRGEKVAIWLPKRVLRALGREAPLPEGPLALRILVDRTSIEIFASGGLVQLAGCFLPPPENRRIAAYAEGGRASATIEARELRSIWE